MISDNNNLESKKVNLCLTPNINARKANFEAFGDSVKFHGYQEYSLSKHWIQPSVTDTSLQKKYNLLYPFFKPRYIEKRTILDLGANSAFYCFWALQQKAIKATAVDIDEEYLDMVRKAKDYLDFENLNVVNANVMDINSPSDIVIALALVHWIYSCTALTGSLDAVVKKLANLTNYMLIVEWIEPDDAAIQFFKHINFNENIIIEPYTQEAFNSALKKYFKKVIEIGDISSSRKLFAAFCTPNEIDLSAPFPFIKPQDTILSGRLLAVNAGIEYWSFVYDAEGVIYKQTTANLALREADFLREFDSEYFPKVKDFWTENNFSVVVIEKIKGENLDNFFLKPPSQDIFLEFISGCLEILSELHKKDIVHRDIRPDNMLIRNGKPVLLDFGWAESNEHKIFTPDLLGGEERPPDGNHSDIYSMGKVIEQVNQGKYPVVQHFTNLMTATDPYLRIHDISILKSVWFSLQNYLKD
ncbi:MAG TPA: hypothetical protein DIV86_07365 [Alphaproteobacteria bacterium]|nr:hypothetical protein [Alphaproteobacteria bacterium]